MIILFVSPANLSVKRVNKEAIKSEKKLREMAIQENAIIININLNSKLSLSLIDPSIETGDHFNIGVSLKEGVNPFFYRYSGSAKISIRDISEDESLWTKSPLIFLGIVDSVENFLAGEVEYLPKVKDWVVSKLS